MTGLADSAEHYHWVGVYLLEGDTLVLHTQVGAPTPHVRIPVSQGLCGAAVRERRTIVVDDVREDPRYLACSLATRSEIVVPIVTPGGGSSARSTSTRICPPPSDPPIGAGSRPPPPRSPRASTAGRD